MRIDVQIPNYVCNYFIFFLAHFFVRAGRSEL